MSSHQPGGGILISGAGGFIGRALATHLDGRGLPVATVGTRRDVRAEHWTVAPGHWSVATWGKALDHFRPATVFHLAGATQGTPEGLQAVNLGLAQALDPTVSAATTSSTGPGTTDSSTTDSSTDTGTSDGFGTVQQVGPGRQMGVDSTTRAS